MGRMVLRKKPLGRLCAGMWVFLSGGACILLSKQKREVEPSSKQPKREASSELGNPSFVACLIQVFKNAASSEQQAAGQALAAARARPPPPTPGSRALTHRLLAANSVRTHSAACEARAAARR